MRAEGSCIGLTHFSTHTPATSEHMPTGAAAAWQQARLKTVTLAYYQRTFTAADWFRVGGWTLEVCEGFGVCVLSL